MEQDDLIVVPVPFSSANFKYRYQNFVTANYGTVTHTLSDSVTWVLISEANPDPKY